MSVDVDWISVSQLAEMRSVSRQAISKRVKHLANAGKISVRGSGRNLRVHRPTFEQVTAATHDLAQDLRNRNQRPAAELAPPAEPELPSAQAPSDYDQASTRQKNAQAAIAEIELARRRGELVPAKELEAASITVATNIAQHVSAIKTKSGQLYAAGRTGGEEAVHVLLVETVNAVLANIAELMSAFATTK